MSERYSRLFTLPENLYAEGSPVILAAGALLKDGQTGRVLAQLKLKSLSDRPIKAITVRIRPLDTAGKPLGETITHQFLDLGAQRNAQVGQKEPIAMPDAATRAFEAAVSGVVFQDNSTWEDSGAPWEALPPPTPLTSALQDRELRKQYQLKFGADCTYLYQTVKDLWFCPCGAINRKGERWCCHCQRHGAAFDGLDMAALSAERDLRMEQERKQARETQKARQEQAAREKAEAEARAVRRKARAKKLGVVAAAAAAAILAAVLVVTKVIVPASQYRQAQALLDARDYDAAIAAFEALGGYRDSAERIADVPYVKACNMRSDGNYSGAVNLFRSLGDYRDSAAQLDATLQLQYDQAAAAVESGAYLDAILLFESLGDFSDAAERAVEADYLYTKSLLDAKQYETAIKRFERLADYRDSEQLLLDAKEGMYQNALSLVNAGNYLEATSVFQSLGNYKDSGEQGQKIVEAIYAEAFQSLNDGKYADALEQFKAQRERYPTLSGSVIDDYIAYCEVKSIHLDDGDRYDLSMVYDMIVSISDETLKGELMELPQMRTIKMLDGVWASGNDCLTFQDGRWFFGTRVDGRNAFSVYYMNGHYCSNIPSADRFDEIYNISQDQFSHCTYINDSYMYDGFMDGTYTRQS